MKAIDKLVESVVRNTIGELSDSQSNTVPKKIEIIVGVYVGRFQPFHIGHYNTYNEMVKQFGKNNVYIATSNVSSGDRHPFDFKEKQKIISKMYGIKKSLIVQEKNVYSPINILSNFDSETTALVVGLGKKDAGRLGGKYYKKFTGKNMEGFEDAGYIYIVPTFKLKVGGTNISGTQVRKLLGSPDIDENKKKKLFKIIFGKFDSSMYDFITNRVMFDHKELDGVLLTKEVIGQFLIENNIKNILKEASTTKVSGIKRGHTSGGSPDDGPGTFYNSFADYYRVSRDVVPLFMQQTGWKVVNFIIREEEDEVLDPDADFTMIYKPISAVGFGRAGSIPGSPNAYSRYRQRLESVLETLGWKIIKWMGFDEKNPDKLKAGVKIDSKLPIEYKLGKKQWISKGTEGERTKLKERIDIIDEVKQLILEGGAYGHLSHPFDDNNLTFRDFRTIITNTLKGEISKEKPATEKTDGQNIMISWRDGKLIAARNKGHLRDKGASALTTAGISKMFSGRGDLHTAFSSAMVDLETAISALSDAQKDKIFKEGEQFMSLEIIYPKTANVIPYEKSMLIFHGVIQYDETGASIGDYPSFARMLAGMIKQIDKDVQSEFAIEYPPVVELPKVKDFSKRKKYYIGKLNSLQKKYKLKAGDTLGDYHQGFWTDYINKAVKKTKIKLPDSVFIKLVKRWAFFDKSYKLSQVKKDLKKFPKFLAWVLTTDKENHKDIYKENILPWEELFLGLGAEIMLNLSMLLTANPEAGAEKIKKDLEATIKSIKSTGDLGLIKKLEGQLTKLDAIGGFGSIVSSEGITFTYGDKLYKYTGTFAPINQILGLLKYI